jgi:hypothetical protein
MMGLPVLSSNAAGAMPRLFIAGAVAQQAFESGTVLGLLRFAAPALAAFERPCTSHPAALEQAQHARCHHALHLGNVRFTKRTAWNAFEGCHRRAG